MWIWLRLGQQMRKCPERRECATNRPACFAAGKNTMKAGEPEEEGEGGETEAAKLSWLTRSGNKSGKQSFPLLLIHFYSAEFKGIVGLKRHHCADGKLELIFKGRNLLRTNFTGIHCIPPRLPACLFGRRPNFSLSFIKSGKGKKSLKRIAIRSFCSWPSNKRKNLGKVFISQELRIAYKSNQTKP